MEGSNESIIGVYASALLITESYFTGIEAKLSAAEVSFSVIKSLLVK